jgi:hypothetical protein
MPRLASTSRPFRASIPRPFRAFTPRPFRALAVAAVMLVAAAACGDDADDASTDTSSPATSDGSTTTSEAPGTTTTDDDTTTTTAAPTTGPPTTAATCPEVEVTGSVEGTATGDLDGDGTDDTVDLTHDGDDWRLFVALGDGGGGDAAGPIVAEGPLMGAQMIGVADVQDDGVDELFVQVGSGASAAIIGLYTVDGCRVVPITFEGGPSAFPVGASIGATSGLQCGGGDGVLYVYTASSDDGESYQVSWDTLHLEGTELTSGGGGTGSASYGDELHTAATTFHCDSLTYGA